MEKIKVGYTVYREKEISVSKKLAKALDSEDDDIFNFAVEELWDKIQDKDGETAGADYLSSLCKIEGPNESYLIEF